MEKLITDGISELMSVLECTKKMAGEINSAAKVVSNCFNNGHTLYTCGNGGSAAEAMHMSEELCGRYKDNRKALNSVCLNSDATLLTCVANDFGYAKIFSRQLEAHGKKGDALIVFSTSGNSENQIEAIKKAKELSITTILIGGKGGGACKELADISLIVPSNVTARIQEVHSFILHNFVEIVENHIK